MSETPDVLDLMITHEIVMRDLYTTFSEICPGHRNLWLQAASEEQQHADVLKSLQEVSSPEIHAAFSRFKPQPIQLSISFVLEKREQALAGGITETQALSVAHELEMALLESAAFKTAASAPPLLRPILTQLAADTQRHAQTLAAALDHERVDPDCS